MKCHGFIIICLECGNEIVVTDNSSSKDYSNKYSFLEDGEGYLVVETKNPPDPELPPYFLIINLVVIKKTAITVAYVLY
ncbi:hypothetical protein PAECIP111894_02927 [Paenibacillus pseudetheri]|uniref:Uncharacterized protein n=1 Tax=Paenibacillus pseudetheri TaxID=2897682 RepID=A0ABN8FH35_9BACL|nr:hypothetical protein PAECIP111894_02927 [Paenibacillus pseudetheri]